MAPKANFAWVLSLLWLFSSGVSAQISWYPATRTAHASLAIIVFAVILPVGGILIRAGNFKNLIWAHAAVQLFGYACFCVTFGTGIWMAYENNVYDPGYFVGPHIEIGIIVFGLLTIQPFVGTIHHAMFKRYNRRTFVSTVHILLGRTVVLLGLVNAGLGLELADNAKTAYFKAYGVLAGIIYFAYMLTIAWLEARSAKEQQWLMQTDGASAKKETGVEAKKFGVYEES